MKITAEVLSGVDLRDVARRWPVYRPGLREKQLRNRIARIRRALRHGGLNLSAAVRLGSLLECDPALFLYGAGSCEQGLPGKARDGGSSSAPAVTLKAVPLKKGE